MNSIATTGIVLKRVDFQEADRILTILTPDQGKISVIAKGVRKPKSKLAGGIELLSVSHVSFIPPKRDIGTLVSARLDVHFGTITSDIQRTTFAFDCLKYIQAVTEDAADESFFELTKTTLGALNDIAIPLACTELWFYLHILALSGHAPQSNGYDNTKLKFMFDFERMSFVDQAAGMYSPSHIKLFRAALQAKSPESLSKIIASEELWQGSAKLAKQILTYQFKLR